MLVAVVIATIFFKNKEEYEAIALNTFYQHRKNTHFVLSDNNKTTQESSKNEIQKKSHTRNLVKPDKSLMYKIINDVNSEDDDAYDILMKKFNEQKVQRQQSLKN